MEILIGLGVIGVILLLGWHSNYTVQREKHGLERLSLLRLTYPQIAFYGEGDYYVRVRRETGAERDTVFFERSPSAARARTATYSDDPTARITRGKYYDVGQFREK